MLEFTEEAVGYIADKALERSTGARGLRAIIEEAILEVMYEIPSISNIEKCIITKETIENGQQPELVINENKKSLKKPSQKRSRIKRESVS